MGPPKTGALGIYTLPCSPADTPLEGRSETNINDIELSDDPLEQPAICEPLKVPHARRAVGEPVAEIEITGPRGASLVISQSWEPLRNASHWNKHRARDRNAVAAFGCVWQLEIRWPRRKMFN
ncbi:hypothetical protein AVEN_193711-1 [Araneus ventricosus]|uniref:Uncharacterized protein n=1 Tax=Araneus ventricosus TaxID=182803 RepID=A0A4Y2BP78_ARAVE|nr:hypothetical protein AVEN_193711-1 [Araneus ventricosus]